MKTLVHAGRTFQHFLEDTTENALRAVGGWARGLALLYGIGAALTLVALFALANALAWGVVELGLPPVAAWFILTVVTGGVGFACFKAGSHRSVSHEARREGRPGLSVQIVQSRSPRRKRTRRTRRVVLPRTADRFHHN